MNCDGVRDLLSAYIDGELSPGELLRVEQHLRRCHCCADEVDSLRQTIALVASLEEVEVPASFHVQLHERLVALGPPVAAPARRSSPAAASRRGMTRWAMPAAAAAAVAALAIGVTTYGGGKIPDGLLVSRHLQADKFTATNVPPESSTVAVNLTDPPVQAKPNTDPPGTTPEPAKPTVTDPTPAPPGQTAPPGSGPIVASPGTPGTSEQVNAQMALTHEFTVARDEELIKKLKAAFSLAIESSDRLTVEVKARFAEEELNRVQTFLPGVKPVLKEDNLAQNIHQADQAIARVRADISSITSMSSEEQLGREQRLASLNAELKSLQDELEILKGRVDKVLIVIKFQNP